MPLLKIYVDASVDTADRANIVDALPPLRDLICDHLKTAPSLCQFSVIAVEGLPDQALVSAEINILPAPERTRDHVLALCEKMKDALVAAADVKTAIRATIVDPQNYIALR